MASKLDKSRPFGVIRGDHPATYFQDGKYFLGNGNEYGKPIKPEPSPVPATDPESATKTAQASHGDDLESMHWSQMRKMVEDAGGVWTGKADAVEFLRNRGGS